MNSHLRMLAQTASRRVNLTYPGDAYPAELARTMVSDLDNELGKLKWAGEDEGWDRAIKAVREELARRYGVKVG
ncbi:MAG: hypothetical protein EBT86_13560 [Actinobacteria bacterium]|nr:hypothetical protein [Actinomycetota bacterium]